MVHVVAYDRSLTLCDLSNSRFSHSVILLLLSFSHSIIQGGDSVSFLQRITVTISKSHQTWKVCRELYADHLGLQTLLTSLRNSGEIIKILFPTIFSKKNRHFSMFLSLPTHTNSFFKIEDWFV